MGRYGNYTISALLTIKDMTEYLGFKGLAHKLRDIESKTDNIKSETFVFTMEDGSKVTKEIMVK